MGYIPQTGGTWAMQQGTLLESRALPWYEFATGQEVRRVGFCTTDDGRIGCSPDGLVGENGGIECKVPEAHTHVGYLIAGTVPKQYLAQIQGCMLVTGRRHWTFLSYNPYLPPLIVRVERDEAAQSALRTALDKFLTEFDRAKAKMLSLMADNRKEQSA